MAIKNYSNAGAGVNVDFGSDFGPDEIVDILGKFEQMSINRAANRRADAQLAIDKANQLFLEQTRQKASNAENAMNTWSSYGINHQVSGTRNPSAAINQKFDYEGDFDRAWRGYSNQMKANKQTPNLRLFEEKFAANYNANLTRVANRFSALKESVATSKGITDTSPGGLLDRIMQRDYNADNLYMALASIHGADGAFQIMGYKPAKAPEKWAKKASRFFAKESYTDPDTGETMGGGLTKKGAATMIAAPALGLGEIGRRSYAQFGPAKEDILKEAKTLSESYKKERKVYEKVKDKKTGKMVNKLNKRGKPIVKKTIPASGISADEFRARYKMGKKEAFVNGKPTDKFIKKANALARKETLGGKILGTGKKYGGMAAGAGIGSQLGEALGEAVTGGPGGEMLGSFTGGAAGAYAGAKGQRTLVNAVKKLTDPKTVKRLTKYAAGKGVDKGIKNALMKSLAKLGVSAAGYLGPQALEPISTVAGMAGTAWAAHDIYQIAKEFPELMDIIFTEE